jgi:tetratricopeptide (TPR) repeat protein
MDSTDPMVDTQSRDNPAANFLLLAGSLLFALLLVGGLEAALRVAGLGDPDASRTSRLKYQQIFFPIVEPAVRPDGVEMLATADVRLPYQSMLRHKPANGLRVFIFGGSATAGLGFSPNVTFARDLERMLELAHPEREVEVVNLGIVALASKQVRLMVADACRNGDPDLVVVYSGNNEFLEIHAEKFASAQGAWISPYRDFLLDTNLYRFVNRAIRGAPRKPSLAEQDFSKEDLRLTQHEIIEQVEMSPSEIAEIVDTYEANIEEMVAVAQQTGTPIIPLTVASNWRWRGREDLPPDWLDELLGEPGQATADRYREARTELSARIESAGLAEQHEWLYRRALAAEALGDHAAARDDFRAAMNQDPHLRRALDAMGDRVRAVAKRAGVPVLDTIELLSASADHGIVGFDEFYDYVHLTPRGALLVAAGIFDVIHEAEILPPARDFDLNAYVTQQIEQLAALQQDNLDVTEWMGIGFDPKAVSDRDLWKYDRMLEDLDRRIEDDPSDLRAIVYRGSASYFRVDGAQDAERDYRTALELAGDHPVIRSNLERLLDERVP